MNPVLVEAWRGATVESFHRGALALADGDGKIVASLGDIDRPVFPRSAIKLLQALPLVESGAAARFALGDDELALACASHKGESVHTRTVAAMLASTGLDATVLECGIHWPYDESTVHALAAAGAAPSALHNNCSGKHAGFVCLGCQLSGTDDPAQRRRFLAGYVEPEHALMREVGAAIEDATRWSLQQAPRGVDGCSIPAYAIPLRHLAQAFSRVASGTGLTPGRAAAARRLRQAVAAAPFMVGGTGSLDSELMQALGERVFCKVGAEGMYCAALPEAGLGLALKMDDGNNSRACSVVMAALVQALVALRDDAERTLVAGHARPRLHNRRGLEVGHLATAAPLDALLTRLSGAAGTAKADAV